MPTLTVDLGDELDAFVDRMVAEGVFSTADEVLRVALERLAAEEEEWEKVRAGIMIGLEQAGRCEVIEGEEAFRRLREKYFERA